MLDEQEIEPLVIPVWPDAGRALGFRSRSATYGAIARGVIPVVRLGHRMMVDKRAIERLIDGDRGEAA
jgi:hypothetical protein